MTTTPRFSPPSSRARLARLAGDERGIALITALIIMSVLLFLGTFTLVSSRSEIRTSSNYRARVQAQYFAESGIDEIVGFQNDLTASTRFLFNAANYRLVSADSAVFADRNAVDPTTGKVIGTIHRVVVGKNPVSMPPPYRLRTTATMNDGSQATYEVDVDAVSLLDFAIYSEANLTFCPPGTTFGRVYTAADFKILSTCTPPEVFMKRVEYVGTMTGATFGNFREGYHKIPAYPSLTSVVNLSFYENATKNSGVCGEGLGLYIGAGGGVPATVKTQASALFGMNDNNDPGIDNEGNGSSWTNGNSGGVAITGCQNTGGGNPQCFQIDLTLFDFAADPITYGGVPLVGWNGAPLRPGNFNGVVFAEKELHVWGILGGRSPEDRTVADTVTAFDVGLKRPNSYPAGNMNPPLKTITSVAIGRPFHHRPKFWNMAAPLTSMVWNVFSNNVLDAGEDTNGNGVLDPARKGRSLTVVTASGADIVIDHNIYYGTDVNGNPLSLGLLAGDIISIDVNAPRALVINAAKLAHSTDNFAGWGGSFVALPKDPQDTHRLNLWAKRAGNTNPADSTYVFDLDGDGTLEANNGMGLASDRNELSMRGAWTILDRGNLVIRGSATHGAWATGGHGGTIMYDAGLITAEPPCWPMLPHYGVVPGSFTEIRN